MKKAKKKASIKPARARKPRGRGKAAAARRARALRLQFPATSANLGPGFDAAALALQLHLRITAEKAKTFVLKARGRDADICGQAAPNLILDTYREILEEHGRKIIPLKLKINNRIPIGKGCGSSAAARLAGIALAVHFGKLRWNDERMLAEAVKREGHGDNAAACWLGGLAVLAGEAGGGNFAAGKLPSHLPWPILLAMPRRGLATEESRQALPTSYEREDAVANVQHAMLLLLGLQTMRVDLVRKAMRDRMHEPYREPLCPLLKLFGELREEEGIAGVALSGAGPGVLIVLDPRAAGWKVIARIRQYLKQQQTGAELIPTVVEGHGASFFWQRRNGRPQKIRQRRRRRPGRKKQA